LELPVLTQRWRCDCNSWKTEKSGSTKQLPLAMSLVSPHMLINYFLPTGGGTGCIS